VIGEIPRDGHRRSGADQGTNARRARRVAPDVEPRTDRQASTMQIRRLPTGGQPLRRSRRPTGMAGASNPVPAMARIVCCEHRLCGATIRRESLSRERRSSASTCRRAWARSADASSSVRGCPSLSRAWSFPWSRSESAALLLTKETRGAAMNKQRVERDRRHRHVVALASRLPGEPAEID
jgi:hypothetical protein